MPTKATPKNDELTQVVVSSFPTDLLNQIKANAKQNSRSVSAEIRHVLAERVQLRRQPQAA